MERTIRRRAPMGNGNALKHGLYTKSAIAQRRALNQLLGAAIRLLAKIEEGAFTRKSSKKLPSPPNRGRAIAYVEAVPKFPLRPHEILGGAERVRWGVRVV